LYEVYKSAEVGNIFPLNTKFTKAFDYYFTDEDGQQKPIYMGCYGIGPSRVMGVLVEKFADEKGLVWPKNVAPFDVHLVSLKSNERAQVVYDELQQKGIDVFYDDREVGAGEKLADADLIGIPVRLIVSDRTGEQIEWKERTKDNSEIISLEEVLQRLQ